MFLSSLFSFKTRLASADRSRVSLLSQKLDQGKGCGRPCKNFHLVWSPFKIWLLFIIPYLRAHVGGSQKLETLGPCPLGWSVADPRKTPLPTCVIMSNLVFLGQTIPAYVAYGDQPGKWACRSLLFHVTQDGTDMDRSLYLLVIHINWAYLLGLPFPR